MANRNSPAVQEAGQLRLALPQAAKNTCWELEATPCGPINTEVHAALPEGGSQDAGRVGTQSWELLLLALPATLQKTLAEHPPIQTPILPPAKWEGEGMVSQVASISALHHFLHSSGSRPLWGAGSQEAGSVPAAPDKLSGESSFYVHSPPRPPGK